MKIHPAADVFPMLSDAELKALAEDIGQNGLQHPIVMQGDTLLDGRNRLKACDMAGVAPRYEQFAGDSAVGYIVSANINRRHLDPSQRAAVAVDLEPMYAAEAKERHSKAVAESNKRRAEIPCPANLRDMESIPESRAAARARESSEQAARAVGASGRNVQEAKAIKQKAPELFEKVKAGTVTVNAAKRELKEAAREQRRQENAKKAEAAPDPLATSARFATIMIDPPWDWGDEGDVNQLGRAKPDYHTMGIEQLENLPVAKLADDDCHIYLWITNRSLPKGFRLLEAWGFRYVTCITWAKPHYGMGNYFRGQTEHILFGVKGSQMLKRKDASTLFSAPRGPNGHSSKPIEIYDFIESCSPGPYLEMFSRVQRDGWKSWGADADGLS